MATGGVDDTCYEISSDGVGCNVIMRLCDPCIRDEKHNDASLFCTICKEFLCSTCKNLHLKYTLGNHDIVSVQEAHSRPSEVDMKGMDRCQEHLEMIKFVCEDHSLLCCSECLFIHRNCKHVYQVKEQCRLHLEEYRSVQASLEKSSAHAHTVIEDCEREIEQINQNESELAKEINAQIDSVIVMLNNTRLTVLKEAHAKCGTETQMLRVRQSICKSIKATIAEILPLYSSVLEAGTPEQAFILTRMFQEKIVHVHIEVTKQDERPLSVKINAEFAPEMSALLKKGCSIVSLKMDDNSLKKGHTFKDANTGPIESFSCRQDFTQDQKQTKPEELVMLNRHKETILKAGDTCTDIDNHVENKEAQLLADSGKIGKPAEILFAYGNTDVEDLMAKKKDDEAVIGRYLLTKCRSLLFDSSKPSTELGESNLILKDAIFETIKMFEACNDFDGLGAAWMLNWVLSENTQCIEKAIQYFRQSKPFENTAGIAECSHLLVQTQNISLEHLEICIRSIHDLFIICHDLLFPNTSEHFDRLLKFESFYGFKPYSIETYAVHPKERPLCLYILQDLFSRKVEQQMQVIEVSKKEVRVSLVNVLLKRIQRWIQPIFSRIQTLRDTTMVCDRYKLDMPCTFGIKCKKLHRPQTKDNFIMLIKLDVLGIECEGHVQTGASSLIEKKCPDVLTSILEMFVTNKEEMFYEIYKGCFCLWHDLMPVDGHSNLIGNDRKMLTEYISGNTVRKQLKEFLEGQWKHAVNCSKGGLLQSQAVRGLEVFMRIEFGYYLFRLTTGTHQFEPSPSAKMRQLEFQLDGEIMKKGKCPNLKNYTLMVSPHNNTMIVECTTRRFIDAFDELLKGDIWEAVEKFTVFIILCSKKDVEVLEPWVFIMWLEFYSTLASLIIAKLEGPNCEDVLFILPNNYLNLVLFIEATLPTKVDIIDTIKRFQASHAKINNRLWRMQDRLKRMAFAVAGFCDYLPLMTTMVKRSKTDPTMFGGIERLLILSMTLVCNVDKTVEIFNEWSLMNMMTKIQLDPTAPARLRKTIQSLQNASGISGVAEVLLELLKCRTRSEELLSCSWQKDIKKVIFAKSSIKTSEDMAGMFNVKFFNVKTLNTVQQNKEGSPQPNSEDLYETVDEEDIQAVVEKPKMAPMKGLAFKKYKRNRKQ